MQRILPTGETDSPWKTLETREIYANPWIRVEENRVLRPDGQSGIYGVVKPVNLATGVVALESDGSIWLVGQYRYTLDRYSWEIPEGGGAPGIDPQLEAARELNEETGLTAERWDHLLTIHTSNCFTDERAEIFLARELRAGTATPEGTEQLQTIRIPFQQALAAIRGGEITDSLTVAALQHVALNWQDLVVESV